MAGPYLQSDCSIGIKKEATYGTAVTVDQHICFVSESLQKDIDYMQSQGLCVGKVGPNWGGRVSGKITAAGDIVFEANSVDTATFLEAAFGTVATGGAAPPYFHLATCKTGDVPPSYTIQKGIPLVGGASVAPHTFTGMVCDQLQINAATDAILQLTATFAGQNMETTTPLVTPAYTASTSLFHFHKATLAIGGTIVAPTTTSLATGGTATADVRGCTITINNHLDTNGWNFGGNGKRTRVQAYGPREITGQMTVEFDAVTLRDASLSNTGLGLLLEFTGGVNETLQIVLPKIGLKSNVPNSNAGDVITQQFDFTAFQDAGSVLAYAMLGNTVA